MFLLVISLDGLSSCQLDILSRHWKWLADSLEGAPVIKLMPAPLKSPQAIWAEILSGRPWFESGCAGYARPVGTLNDLQIFTEDDLNNLSLLTPKRSGRRIAIINMPLLKPMPDQRLWLSDGSMPIQMKASPEELLAHPHTASYRPRPFAAASIALANRSESVQTCLQTEYHRLRCAREILSECELDISFLRLTVFDQLAHLLGPEFLSDEDSIHKSAINSFLQETGPILAEMIESSKASHVAIISTHLHRRCTARLNLNFLLFQGGYCNFKDAGTGPEPELRLTASQLIAATRQGELPANLPVSVSSDVLDSSSTIAASPVEGAVYVNLMERYSDGLVRADEAGDTRKQLSEFLRRTLQKDCGENLQIWTADLSNGPLHPLAPDLMLYADGLDFHASGPPGVDFQNRPASTHGAEGFVVLPANHHATPHSMRPSQLNKVLREMLR